MARKEQDVLTMANPKHPKSYYRRVSTQGFVYGGFWDNRHHFQKETRDEMGLPVYHPIQLKEEDTKREVLEFYIKHNITCLPEPSEFTY